jgi:hypothetical protein
MIFPQPDSQKLSSSVLSAFFGRRHSQGHAAHQTLINTNVIGGVLGARGGFFCQKAPIFSAS